MRPWIFLAGVNGAVAVGMAAYGAHGVAPGVQGWMEKASLFQLVHAVALLGLDGRAAKGGAWANLGGCLLTLGVILFSGSLYWKSLVGPLPIPMITPAGGVAFMAGWAALAVAGLRKEPLR